MIPRSVAVALSGGVDSLISGYLVKRQYKEVFGIHFFTGYEKSPVNTRMLEDQLGFKVHTLDLTRRFKQEVVDYFVDAYLSGQTPNPCLLCNHRIKFGALLDHARELGAEALATGHYASIVNPISDPEGAARGSYLKKGEDPKKDQSYFLAMLRPSQLDRLIFPLAAARKEEVKAIAQSNRLVPAVPSESQDVCFIHDQKIADFIHRERGTHPSPGRIVDPDGRTVGTHQGLHAFTIGQRRGINVPAPKPYYVRQIDMAANTLHVCYKEDLAQSDMMVRGINWNYDACSRIDDIMVKIRYSHPGARAALSLSGDRGHVVFHTPQNAVTPGQAAVFYRDDRVLGAGIIQ